MARMAMSTALPAALVATILPLRSSTFWIGLSLSTKNWLLWWPSVPSLNWSPTMRKSSNPAFSIASGSDEKARLPSSISFHQLGLLRKERRPVGRRHDPTGTDLDRLGAVRRCARKEHGQGQHPPQCAHVFFPSTFIPSLAREDITAGEGRPRQRLVPRTRTSRTPCGKCGRELRVQKGTRIIELLVVLRFRSSYLNVPRALTNFGIGPLVASS